LSKFWKQFRRIEAGWVLLYSIPGFRCFAHSLCQAVLPIDSTGAHLHRITGTVVLSGSLWTSMELALPINLLTAPAHPFARLCAFDQTDRSSRPG
jgi:hypothetical protein